MANQCKYYKQKKQYSLDGGVTWYDVVPSVYQKGELYEYNSEDCNIYLKQYLTFIPTSGSSTFGWETPSASTASANTVYYSLDSGSTWISIASGETVTVGQGNKIFWKSSGLTGGIGSFTSTNYFDVEGNIMSLLYGDNFENQTSLSGKNYAFFGLFSGCTNVVSAENLALPATTLANNCYDRMFSGCTSLTTAPTVLPATTLTQWCYDCMFANCSSLTTVPELPATKLASWCYYYMFWGCTSLTTAPELPATTLANNCYAGMFYTCTSLTTAPELPATTLAEGCYGYMFCYCTSLTEAPELPATTLATYCYYEMFFDCTSLTTAPVLSATTLAEMCYQSMFEGCTNLNYIKCLATNISANNCTTSWVTNVASNGTFVKDANMTSWTTGSNGIPTNWTVQNA